MQNDKHIGGRKTSGRSRGVRQICAKRPGSPALDGFQLGVRIPENAREMSFPRYEFAVTSCVSRNCGKIIKNAAPDLRQKNSRSEPVPVKPLLGSSKISPTKKCLQVSARRMALFRQKLPRESVGMLNSIASIQKRDVFEGKESPSRKSKVSPHAEGTPTIW